MILEYSEKSKIDITECIFHFSILFRMSKYFFLNMKNSKLIEMVQIAIQDKRSKEWSPSPIQSFFSYFKQRNSTISETSNLSFPFEINANIKQLKSQYQTLKIRKLFFETSDLSQHLIKNLQTIINIISDVRNKVEE